MNYFEKSMKEVTEYKKTKILDTVADTLVGLIALTALMSAFLTAAYVENHYTMNAEVVAVNGKILTFEDTTGNLWEAEDLNFRLNDKVEITFDDNHTTTRRDDIIIRVKDNKSK